MGDLKSILESYSEAIARRVLTYTGTCSYRYHALS